MITELSEVLTELLPIEHRRAIKSHLRPGEPRANFSALTPTKRAALLACLKAGALHREKGKWLGYANGHVVAGVTVADLIRDGFLIASIVSKREGMARLTARGSWFARTIADEET